MREWIVETASSMYMLMGPLYVVTLFAILFIFIPMGFFDRTRSVSVSSLWVASYIFNITGWVYSVAVAFALLGWFWLIVGLLFAGLGVAPVAFIGALLRGPEGLAIGVAFPFILGFGSRFLAAWLENKGQ